MKNTKLLLALAAIMSAIAIWTVEVVNFIFNCATMLTGLFEIISRKILKRDEA